MYEPKATSWASIVVNEFVSLQLMVTSPLLDWFVSIAYDDFDSSLSSASKALLSEPLSFFTSRLPTVTTTSIAAYLAWVAFQAFLYVFVPGPLHQAPRTPGGRRLFYRLNGFRAWLLTLALAACASFAGLVDPSLLAKHWTTMIATAVVYSSALIGIFYIKARVTPDNKDETLLSGKSPFFLDFRPGTSHARYPVFFKSSLRNTISRPALVRSVQRWGAPSTNRTIVRLEAFQRQPNRRNRSMDLDV